MSRRLITARFSQGQTCHKNRQSALTKVIITFFLIFIVPPSLEAMERIFKKDLENTEKVIPTYSFDEHISMPLRGILLFNTQVEGSDKQTIHQFKALVSALQSKHINFVIFDMHWGNFKYEKTPKISATSAHPIDKALASQLSNIAKKAGMTVGVRLNFLSHQNFGVLLKAYPEYAWIQKNGDPLTADPRTKDTPNLWDPLNPGVNKIAFSMADELIDAFHPDIFHAGMDEPWGFDAANLKSNKDHLTTDQLYASIIKAYHAHITETRGLPMMIWADSFEPIANRRDGLGATKALDMIPKDIILSYWHYSTYRRYPPMWTFAEKGFRVTASPWNDVQAAKALLKDAQKLRSVNGNMIGSIYTTWSSDALLNLAPALNGTGGSDNMKKIADVINATENIIH